VTPSGADAVLLLPATVTLSEAVTTLQMLAQALPRNGTGRTLVVEASGLQRFDSSVLAVLLECRRLGQSVGKQFQVRGTPAQLVRLAKLYGVDSLLASPAEPGEATHSPAAT
jgi:phospholipid transport system transporter-binding protein